VVKGKKNCEGDVPKAVWMFVKEQMEGSFENRLSFKQTESGNLLIWKGPATTYQESEPGYRPCGPGWEEAPLRGWKKRGAASRET